MRVQWRPSVAALRRCRLRVTVEGAGAWEARRRPHGRHLPPHPLTHASALRLPPLPQVLSVVSAQIRAIQNALNARRSTVDIGLGTEMRVNPKVGIFITMVSRPAQC